MSKLPPVLAPTLWDGDNNATALTRLKLLSAEGLDTVQYHASLGDTGVPTELAALRSAVPGLRWFLGLAANSLAVGPRDAALKAAEQWARYAASEGALCLMLNAEEDEKHRPEHGWSKADWTADRFESELRPRMAALLELVSGILPVAFTSHDFPSYHPIPWEQALGPDSKVAWAALQNYPGTAPPAPPATLAAMKARLAGSLAHSAPIAARYRVEGDSYGPYLQLYGVECGALTWAADQYDRVCLGWTLGEADAEGLRALRVMLRARKECGASRGALSRWQAEHGLVADGIAGPKTLAAMGL